jgi:hypothetical protein
MLRTLISALALFGFTSTATMVAAGTSSCTSSSRFSPSAAVKKLMPVALPPGRLRLATRPNWTGSLAVVKTIGIVDVAAFAANDALMKLATITPAGWRTSSAASAGSRSLSLRAQRYWISRLRPSSYPVSLKPRRNAATRCPIVSGEVGLKKPITRVPGCTLESPRWPLASLASAARAASGHAAAAPPSSAMKSRRLIRSPRRQARASLAAQSARALWPS